MITNMALAYKVLPVQEKKTYFKNLINKYVLSTLSTDKTDKIPGTMTVDNLGNLS